MSKQRPSNAEMRRTLDAFLLEVDEPAATDPKRIDARTPTASPDATRAPETRLTSAERRNEAAGGRRASHPRSIGIRNDCGQVRADAANHRPELS